MLKGEYYAGIFTAFIGLLLICSSFWLGRSALWCLILLVLLPVLHKLGCRKALKSNRHPIDERQKQLFLEAASPLVLIMPCWLALVWQAEALVINGFAVAGLWFNLFAGGYLLIMGLSFVVLLYKEIKD